MTNKEQESLEEAKKLLEECLDYFDNNRVERELRDGIVAFLNKQFSREVKETIEDNVC